jgi:hypothetical protein
MQNFCKIVDIYQLRVWPPPLPVGAIIKLILFFACLSRFLLNLRLHTLSSDSCLLAAQSCGIEIDQVMLEVAILFRLK